MYIYVHTAGMPNWSNKRMVGYFVRRQRPSIFITTLFLSFGACENSAYSPNKIHIFHHQTFLFLFVSFSLALSHSLRTFEVFAPHSRCHIGSFVVLSSIRMSLCVCVHKSDGNHKSAHLLFEILLLYHYICFLLLYLLLVNKLQKHTQNKIHLNGILLAYCLEQSTAVLSENSCIENLDVFFFQFSQQ